MELQETRQYILEILRQREPCTVDDIVTALADRIGRKITTVTVRHHLDRLLEEELLQEPQVLRRNTPGRPQYTYSLSEKAYDYFPNNYAGLANTLLSQMKQHMPHAKVNVIMEGMADSMASHAQIAPDAPLEERLQQTVQYLNDNGYVANFESVEDGYILKTTNCPYELIVEEHHELCHLDLRLVSSLVGVVPRFRGNLREGSDACEYFIPAN